MRDTIRTTLAVLLAAVVVAAVLSAAQAREAVLRLKDGRTVTGELISQTDDDVELRIANVPARFKRADIESIELLPSVEEEYRNRRAALEDGDIEGRYRLANWLIASPRRAYQLAKPEVDQLASQAPDHDGIRVLKQTVDNQLRLGERSPEMDRPAPAATPTPDAAESDEPAASGEKDSRLPTTLLNDDQINLIKVYLIEPNDRPAVRVPPEVLDEVFARYSDDPLVPRGTTDRNRLRGRPGHEQLALLFELRARELYPKVEVRTDPQHIREFRSTLHQTYVLNYCGTAMCHGGEDAGKFFIFRKTPPNSDDLVYTNFYITRTWEDNRGFMVDVERPERSYLIQYALDREVADTPHPEVRGWRPRFTRGRPAQLVQLENWIRSLGPEQRFAAPVEYELPTIAVAEPENDDTADSE